MKIPLLRRSAFSLIEVVLAMGIITFAITSLLGLMTVGYQAGSESTHRTDSSLLVDEIIGQLRAKPFPVEQVGVVSTNSATPSRLPLPPLNVVNKNPTSFFVDVDNRYIGNTANSDAVRGVRVKVFAAKQFDGELWTPADVTAGDIASIEIEIFWPPLAPQNRQQKITYSTIVSSLAQ